MESDGQGVTAGTLFAERYLIKKLLGAGGMGEVFLATDTMLNNERVALKIIYPQFCKDEKQIKRFFREVQLTRRVNHSSVVRTFDVGASADRLFMTMELLEGTSLKDRIDAGALEANEIPDILRQICEGLEAIHAAGIIHRDLKPANIVTLPNGTLKIADFGVARTGRSDLTGDHEVVGSAPYMAPELWLGKEISKSADIYALGVVAYELYTGILPFDGESPAELMCKHLESHVVAPIEVAEEMPYWANTLILKMLAKDPCNRPASATEVMQEIAAGLVGKKSGANSRLECIAPVVPQGFDPLQAPVEEASPGETVSQQWVSNASVSSNAKVRSSIAMELGLVDEPRELILEVRREPLAISLLWTLIFPWVLCAIMWGGGVAIGFACDFVGGTLIRLGVPSLGVFLESLIRCAFFALPAALIVAPHSGFSAARLVWGKMFVCGCIGLALTMCYYNWTIGYPFGAITLLIENGLFEKIATIASVNLADTMLLLPESTLFRLDLSDGVLVSSQKFGLGLPTQGMLAGFWFVYLVALRLSIESLRGRNRQRVALWNTWQVSVLAAALPVVFFTLVGTVSASLGLASGTRVTLAGVTMMVSVVGVLSAVISWMVLTMAVRRMPLEEPVVRQSGMAER